MLEFPINKIIQGNALTEIKKLPSESISCIMTSPPYWALRDYGIDVETIWDAKEGCEHNFEIVRTERPNSAGGTNSVSGIGKTQPHSSDYKDRATYSNVCSKCGAWKGQLGLEPTFDLYIKHLCDIFDEAQRVLRKDGTCWVNIGDTYGGSGNASGHTEKTKNLGYITSQMGASKGNQKATKEMEKSLCLIPFRFAIEMQNRGWILRNVIIWHKPNCMPSSVKDRFTVDFEYLFFFVKSKKYWFETQYENLGSLCTRKRSTAFRQQDEDEEKTLTTNGRNKRAVWDIKDRVTPYAIIEPEFRKEIIDFRNLPEHDAIRTYLAEWKDKKGITIEQIENHFGNQAGHHWFEKDGSYLSKDDWLILKELLDFDDTFDEAMTTIFQKSGLKQNSLEGRIKRTVWRICPRPFKEAHFAVYPEELCETPIKAGCPEFICKKCGKAREKIYEGTSNEAFNVRVRDVKEGRIKHTDRTASEEEVENYEEGITHTGEGRKFKGYTDCNCQAGFESGIVLDMFMGAGTTALVALKQNKRFIGIELQSKYIDIAMKRLKPYLSQQRLEAD
jgi:site-specific DNA-methyltransferase (adenine-specific)